MKMPVKMYSLLVPLMAGLLGLGFAPDNSGDQIRAVLQQVIAHQSDLDLQLERFAYTETYQRTEDGKPKAAETYEVTFYKGRKVRRLTSRNGKPLDATESEKENQRIEKQVRNLENGNIPPLSNRRVKLEDLLHCSVFTNVQQTQLDGRSVLSADFHPNLQVKPRNVNERFVYNLDGKIWVDPSALQVARFEFALRDKFNLAGGLWFSMKPGTHFLDKETWQFSRIWLPETHEFDMNAKAMIGVKLLIDEITTYSNFKEFNVSGHDSATKQ